MEDWEIANKWWQEGFDAALDGLKLSDNPYHEFPEMNIWETGWWAGQNYLTEP